MTADAPILETTGATSGLRFKLEKLIGQGSFGLVYKAVQLGLMRPVALKLLHPDALSNHEQVGRFLNEARVTASLEHPHVVQVIDHGIAGEQPWIAFEFLPGATLRALLPKEGFPWARALEIGLQVGSALDEAHRQGIIHRDVKPENVMEGDPGVFKVTDFGLAKWNHRAAFRTASASCMGTPAYIAPELIATGKASPFTDQYALGVLVYEMLTGQVPFAGDTAAAIVERHLKATPTAPSAIKPGIPPAVDRAVLTALSKNPRDRFNSVADFRAALESTLIEPTPVSVAPQAGGRSSAAKGATHPSISREFWFYFAVAGAVAAALILLDPFGFRTPRTPRSDRDPTTSSTTTPARPRPITKLSAAEPIEMREQLLAILARQEARAGRTKELMASLNPMWLRLADAAPTAAALESEIRADQRLLTVLHDRALAYYPEPEQIPDAELTLIARLFVNATRGWCWLENMSNTREAIDATLAAHGDQTSDSTVLAEMESRSYSPGGDAFVIESLRAVREVFTRMESHPELVTPEAGELFTELFWLASVVGFRAWPEEAQVRLREASRALTAATGPLTGTAAAVYELGGAKMHNVRAARETARQAITRLAASGLPHAREIADRLERELSTVARATASPSPAPSPTPSARASARR